MFCTSVAGLVLVCLLLLSSVLKLLHERSDMDMYEVPLSMSMFGFWNGC